MRVYDSAKCGLCIHNRVCQARDDLNTFLMKHDFLLVNDTNTTQHPKDEFRDLLAHWCYWFEKDDKSKNNN